MVISQPIKSFVVQCTNALKGQPPLFTYKSWILLIPTSLYGRRHRNKLYPRWESKPGLLGLRPLVLPLDHRGGKTGGRIFLKNINIFKSFYRPGPCGLVVRTQTQRSRVRFPVGGTCLCTRLFGSSLFVCLASYYRLI